MTRKIIIMGLTLALSTYAFANTDDSAPTIYSNGVKDTLSIGENFFKDAKVFTDETRTKIIKGYMTYTDAVHLNESEIVRMTAVGIKNGYDVSFLTLEGRDIICYSTSDRKPDAEYIQKRLASYNIESKVLKVDTRVEQVNLVGRGLINAIIKNLNNLTKAKDDRITQLEKYVKTIATNQKADNFPEVEKDKELYNKNIVSGETKKEEISLLPSTEVKESKQCAPCKETKCPTATTATPEKIDLSSMQVVNRVVTKEYLLKIAKGKIANIAPLNDKQAKDTTVEVVEKQIRTVAKNIKVDAAAPLPKLGTFSKAFSYIREHGAITKDGRLILNGKAYKNGDKIDRWALTSVDYLTGVIVIDELFVTGINKK